MEKQDNIKIHTSKFMFTLTFREFDSDIDIDDLIKIQYDNIFGEMITAPALLNKIGLLRADVEAEVKEEKLDLKIFEAQKESQIAKEIIGRGDKATEGRIAAEVSQDVEVIAKRKKLIQIEKQYAYIDAMYWAVRDKCEKLNNILKPVTPEEFQDSIIEGAVNTLIIKKFRRSE